jgi:hypothetical protein
MESLFQEALKASKQNGYEVFKSALRRPDDDQREITEKELIEIARDCEYNDFRTQR